MLTVRVVGGYGCVIPVYVTTAPFPAPGPTVSPRLVVARVACCRFPGANARTQVPAGVPLKQGCSRNIK